MAVSSRPAPSRGRVPLPAPGCVVDSASLTVPASRVDDHPRPVGENDGHDGEARPTGEWDWICRGGATTPRPHRCRETAKQESGHRHRDQRVEQNSVHEPSLEEGKRPTGGAARGAREPRDLAQHARPQIGRENGPQRSKRERGQRQRAPDVGELAFGEGEWPPGQTVTSRKVRSGWRCRCPPTTALRRRRSTAAGAAALQVPPCPENSGGPRQSRGSAE